jgi:hypothetical protein
MVLTKKYPGFFGFKFQTKSKEEKAQNNGDRGEGVGEIEERGRERERGCDTIIKSTFVTFSKMKWRYIFHYYSIISVQLCVKKILKKIRINPSMN